MPSLRRFVLRLLNVFRPDGPEPDLAREVDAHLTMLADDFQRRGMSRDEAQVAAKRAFGGVEQTKELHRDARSFRWLDELRQDVRYGLRTLRRDRAFSLAAIVMLALAIGLNVTVFTVMNAMLFRGLPLANRSDRLVYIDVRKPSGLPAPFSYADFEAWRSQTQAFEGLAFRGAGGPITFREGNGRPIDMNIERV